MQKAAAHTLTAVLMTAAAVLVLGACTREERKEVRTETKQATTAVANVVDNAALTTKVKAALIADELVKGTQINVDSNAGVVKLTGTVDTPAQVTRAVDVAKGVQGVQRVENNLTSSPSAAPGLVPGTQPPGTSPAATPAPNSMTPPAKKP
jgi:hyperosmotically inducible protein